MKNPAEELALAVARHKLNDYCLCCGCARYEEHGKTCAVRVVLGDERLKEIK